MINELDFYVLDLIQNHLRTPFFDKVVPLFTQLGDGGCLWIILTLILLLFRHTRKYGIAMAAALILDLLLCNLILKPLVARPRPFALRSVELLISRPGDHSFPSGHTASSFAAAGALWFMKARGRVSALAAAALMGLSRLYLYVHFPTDILGGVLLGLFCGFAGAALVQKIWIFGKKDVKLGENTHSS